MILCFAVFVPMTITLEEIKNIIFYQEMVTPPCLHCSPDDGTSIGIP